MIRFVGIDPGTNTGLVALDPEGNVLVAESLRGKGKKEKGGITTEQLVSLENQLYARLQPNDEIVIESPAFGTQSGVSTGMIHGGLRTMIHRKKLVFNTVNPLGTKKYVGVTGWTGEAGKKRRLKDKEKKEAVKEAVLEHWGWTHPSHDVIDAYVIARIAWNVYLSRELFGAVDTLPYQIEVVSDILRES